MEEPGKPSKFFQTQRTSLYFFRLLNGKKHMPGVPCFQKCWGFQQFKPQGLVSGMTHHPQILPANFTPVLQAEFFQSENAIYHWAKAMQPDAIIFGFTLTNIAMICSESLGIPIVGALNPGCIPNLNTSQWGPRPIPHPQL